MDTIGIVLDPSEVATDRTELDLHSGAYRIAGDGPDWGDAEVAASLAERRFGSVPVGYRLPNRIVTIPLILRGGTGTTLNAAQTALQQKVARFQDEGGWLKRTSRDGTSKLYADVVNASLTFPEQRYAEDVVPDVVLTLECLPDFYGDEAKGSDLSDALLALEPLALFDPDPDTGTVIDRTGNYTATLQNGATVTTDEVATDEPGAISLDGTNDYVSTTATTRRNLCTNPRAAVDVTGITGTSLASGPTKATMPTTGGLPTSLPTTGVNIVGNAADDRASWSVAVTSGTAYTFSVYVRLSANTATGVVARINNAGGTQKAVSSTLSATGGSFTRLTATVTADATETWTFDIRQLGAGGVTVDYTAALIEAASSAGDYFDGSGHVNASGTWVSDGLTGWLGTAHASASDCGVFANGTTRTFVAVAYVDSFTTQPALFSEADNNGHMRIDGTGGVVFLPANSAAATWAAAWPGVGQPVIAGLTFDESANTASLYVNGVSKGSLAMADAWPARQRMELGGIAGGVYNPFDGLIGPVAIFDRALTAEEHRVLSGEAFAEWSSSGDNDSLILVENDVPGDYPPRSRYTFTDTGSQARQAVVIASQSRTYDPATTAELVYEAEDLTPLDTAAVVTQTGAHGGATNNAVEHASIGPQWTPVLSTQVGGATGSHMTHRGTYRVLARVYASYAASMRLEYTTGDSTRTVNAAVTVPAGSVYFIRDLGEVRLPDAATGTPQWRGTVLARTVDGTAASILSTVGVDKVWLVPTESLTIVKSQLDPSVLPGVPDTGFTARDEFNQTAGSLTGKTIPVGGTWASLGDADDFALDTATGTIRRTVVNDSLSQDMTSPHYSIAGTTSFGSCVVSADFSSSLAAGDALRGLVLRCADINNLWAVFFNGYGQLRIDKRVASSVTNYYYFSSAPSALAGLGPVNLTVALSGGLWRVFVDGVLAATGYDPDLAVGLATGKVGIMDWAPTGTAAETRTVDNFAAYVPATDAACLSGKTLSARHDGAWRETADSGIYAPAHVEGAYPRAPASGAEGRVCRTLILPSAGDLDTLPDTDPVGFSVAAAHRPTYLFAPEE